MKDHNELITLDPEILVGKPIIKGTRLSVEFVLGLLADGWPEGEMLRQYPTLTHRGILACIAYARDRVSEEKAYPSAA